MTTNIVTETDELISNADLADVVGGANPLGVTADKLHPGLVNTQGNSFQPLNCVKASEALPNPPAALKDTWVCTANGAPQTAPSQ